MIHAVRFRNFKALRDVELQLDRLTVLVGPNASGKTSVLEGIHHLSRLASSDPRQVFEGPSSIGVIASRGAEGALELALSGTFRRKRGDLSISFPAIEDYPFTDTYRLDSRWGDRRSSVRRELSPPEDQAPPPPADMPLGHVMREAAYLRFDLGRLAEPSYSDLPTPVIGPDGSGLAAAVADMAVARPDEFQRLQDALRAVIPGLLRVRLVRAKVPRPGRDGGLTHDAELRTASRSAPHTPGLTPEDEEGVWGHEIVFDMAGATDIPARAASEGMLLALGLFAVLMGPDRHSSDPALRTSSDRRELVLVDHLERGFSHRSFGELCAQIDQVLAIDPFLQIVAVTDSPALLDHVPPESVRVHCLLEDGSVRIKPLTMHPELEMLRADLRPGAFWVQVGDDWVAEEPRFSSMPGDDMAPVEDAAPLEIEAGAAEGAEAPGGTPWPSNMPPLPSG